MMILSHFRIHALECRISTHFILNDKQKVFQLPFSTFYIQHTQSQTKKLTENDIAVIFYSKLEFFFSGNKKPFA